MTRQEIQHVLQRQRAYYQSGATLPVAFRKTQLKKLYAAINKHQEAIHQALKQDLGKSAYESFMCEIGLVLSEISYMLRHLKAFSKRKSVHTPLAQFFSRSYKQAVPYGNVLIMSPWNYPFLLTLEPLVDALAAGNTAIVKPSAYSPATSKVVKELLEECFAPEYVAVVSGGREENAALLQEKFDLIFFTGSQAVGKEVMAHAAKHITPVVLELGGKSPCIVDASAKVKVAARRIVFGKYLNCGQTCVAPDYVLCDASVKDELIRALVLEIQRQYGKTPLQNPDYGKIINRKHFDRLCALMDSSKTVVGGDTDPHALQIAPTVLDGVDESHPAMQEEIFGPILPVLSYENFDSMIDALKRKDKPLALYLFSHNNRHIRRVVTELSYGGGCINDVVIHLATDQMGFGGVGESGMGSYHGKDGFDAFSHYKSIVNKSPRPDLPMRYQPYKSKVFEKLLHFFLR